jgi:hypothetical protein
VAGAVASLEHYAQAVAVLTSMTVGAISALVFLCTREVVDSTVVRVALASTTVLIPAGPMESTGNLANVHWYFLWLSAWLVLARPARQRHSVALGVIALFSGLTEIQTVLFLPIALLRWRDRRMWPVAAGLAVGAAAQMATSLTSPRTSSDAAYPTVVDLGKGFLVKVVMPIWEPSVAGTGTLLVHGWWFVLLLALPFAAAMLVLAAVALQRLRRSPLDRRVLTAAVLAAGAVVPFAAAIVVNRQPGFRFDSFTLPELGPGAPLRYGVVPEMCLVAAVLVVVDLVGFGAGRWRSLLAGLVLVGTMGLQVVHVMPTNTVRSEGPRWAPGVRAALDACAERQQPPVVQARPDDYWSVLFTCGRDGRLSDPRPAILKR